ncbi:hypothetical protein ILUMI_21855 [Ignelater luminosus]|uniref:Uncharacterized protein n=1 Tax=Ignelater luminosus TaxID=2038154 RepID=A0A8K0CFN5_IGNLU|nr:hypothetical protein ILUMI_21855 [Ignelater luminosus]
MRSTIIFYMLLNTALSKPDSYFHQQYQYKSSSSSYKNNELAHKDEDEGYYSRHENLEGRTEPKVNSYSQHSEYINPKFRNGGLSEWASGGHGSSAFNLNRGASGYSQDYQHGSSASDSGVYSSGTQGSSSYKTSRYSGGISFGTTGHNGNLYPTGQLQILSQQLQDDLSRQLENAIHEQQQRHYSTPSSYSYGSNQGANIQLLEQELQNNLTRQLQEALDQQYGQQSQSGSHYYSVTSSGAQSSQPNYSTLELERLRKQLEDNLLRQLQQDFQTQSIQTSRTSSSTTFGRDQTDGYGSGYPRPVDSPIHLTPGSHHSNSFDSATTYNSKPTYGSTSYGTSFSHGTYGITERSSVVPLTDIHGQLGRNLIDQFNPTSDVETQKYSHSSTSSLFGNQNHQTRHPDYQSKLQALTDERPLNVTRKQHGSYQYTITSGSAHSLPNYKVDEVTDLRQLQVGNNQQDLTRQVKQIGDFGQQQVELIQHDNSNFGQTHINNLGHQHSQRQLGSQHNLYEHLEISSRNKGYHNQGSLGYNIIHSPHQDESRGSRYITHYTGQGNTFGQIHYAQPQVTEDFSELTDLNLQTGKNNQDAQVTKNLNKHVHNQKQSGYNHHSSYSSYSSSGSHTSYNNDDCEMQSALNQEDTEARSDSTVESLSIPHAKQGYWEKSWK